MSAKHIPKNDISNEYGNKVTSLENRVLFLVVKIYMFQILWYKKFIYSNYTYTNISIFLQASSQEKKEAKLARILILIVFFFLACNIPKIALTLHDLGSFSFIKTCESKKLQYRFPLWVTMLLSANHVFLVMNASANIFLFMVTGTQVCKEQKLR